jgi:predicted SAM-dependent methyltransferase
MNPRLKERIKRVARSLCNRDVYLALEVLFIESCIFFYDKKGRRRLERNDWRRPARINLGSGSMVKKGYLNIDMFPGGDLTLDLRKGLPFESGSCERIFSEHFFEHLDHLEYGHIGYSSDARRVTAECFRILRPGGFLSLSVPDAEWPLTDYSRGLDAPFFKVGRESGWFPATATRLEPINRYFRQAGEHRYMYDFESLQDLLGQAGFVEISRRPFDPEMDTETRRVGSLFVLARKPEALDPQSGERATT